MNSGWMEVVSELKRFRDERNWAQFHNSKDLALALSIEASELNELYLWKGAEDADEQRLKDELADVFTYALLIADKHGFDPGAIVLQKLERNKLKYPVEKSFNSARKYNEL